MKQFKRSLAFATLLGTCLLTTGCADDTLSKGLMVMGGAGAGALVGNLVAKGTGSSRITGGVIGAIAGGGLGFLLGGALGKK